MNMILFFIAVVFAAETFPEKNQLSFTCNIRLDQHDNSTFTKNFTTSMEGQSSGCAHVPDGTILFKGTTKIEDLEMTIKGNKYTPTIINYYRK